MDPRQQDALVQRLVRNPQDQAAIAEAHAAGQRDPEGYARLLEKVGLATAEPSLSSHWLNEAANVWLTTFQDPHRAASVLLAAVDRDPLSDVIPKRLSDLYRGSNDVGGLVTLLERRATALAQLARREPDWLPRAAELYEELGRLCAEPPVSDASRAKHAYAQAVDLDPTSQFSIYSLRELHKAAGEYTEALPYFGMEVALVTDQQRKLALYLDEVEVAKLAGRPERAQAALRNAFRLDPSDPTLRQQLATLVLERYRGGHAPSELERLEAAELFVGLAEQYPGEHGFLYSLCASELVSTHDRALQLAIFFGEQLGRVTEVAPLAAAYLRDNPQGLLRADAERVAGDAPPLAAAVHAASAGAGLQTAAHQSGPPGAYAAGHASGANPTGAGVGERAAAARAGLGAAAAFAPAVAGSAALEQGASARTAAGARGVTSTGLSLDDLLERADGLARKSRKNEAIAVYRQILDFDPINSDALQYLQEQLPLKRKFAELREVLLLAVDSGQASGDEQLNWLREAAAVSETHLRDLDGAVHAWQRIVDIDPEDEEAPDHLKRLLERARRWDELSVVLQAEAERTEDLETRIALEKNLSKLHSERRKDPAAAGEAWARIARLSPSDEAALQEAVRWFEAAERGDRAADVISEHVAQLDDDLVKRELYFKLGALRVAQGQPLSAAESLAQGAEELGDAEMWARAEANFAQAGAFEPAAHAADEQAQIAEDDATKAAHIARAAAHLVQGGDAGEAITRLEQAVALAPTHEPYANSLEELLVAADRVDEMVTLFLTRASKLDDVAVRVHLRKRAATIQRDRLADTAAARASFALVLQDVEDPETLQWLADEAEQRGDADTAVDYLTRFVAAVPELERKIETSLRQAELCAGVLHDIDAAAERYDFVLRQLDPKNQAALQRLGELELGRGEYARAAGVLERLLDVTSDREQKLEIASKLADMYEQHLAQPKDAIRLLNFIHSTDPDDLDATQRLCELAEADEQWSLVAELMVELIAIEGEEDQVSDMTRRLARILHDKLNNGAEALNVLGSVADQGDEACRTAYVELGDELGEKAVVARRVVSWHAQRPPSAARSEALHGAFRRLVEAGQPVEAIAVAKDLAKSGSLNEDTAETLERLAVAERDLEALSVAHELQAKAMEGAELCGERVRQAEVLVGLDVPSEQAVEHGEQALGDLGVEVVEPWLARLAALCQDRAAKIDVYERQIARFQGLDDRVAALCRTAEVAANLGDEERSGSLYEVALGGSLDDAALQLMVDLVRAADERNGDKRLTKILVGALSGAGQGARDAGKTRARMLRLAAKLSHEDLGDLERALTWLGDALLSHVDDVGLDTLEELAQAEGDLRKADAVLSRAISEVFDGPVLRRLLARRARLRRVQLEDLPGAAEDLKRLHELAPSDQEVTTELTEIYETLGEYRGMVALIEDQILRNRDTEQRSRLARRVALLWQDELKDPRETADAWRRVLRLLPGDDEAKQGLARAKEQMLEVRSRQPSNEPVLEEGSGTESSQSESSQSESSQSESSPIETRQSQPALADVVGAADVASAEPPADAVLEEPADAELEEPADAAREALATQVDRSGKFDTEVTEELGYEEPEAEAAVEGKRSVGADGGASSEVDEDDPVPARQGEDTTQEALLDALRRSDLPPEDSHPSGEFEATTQMHELPAQRALPGDLDDFDTATEVTSRAKELLLPETSQEAEIVLDVEEDFDEPVAPGAPQPPSKPKSAGGAATPSVPPRKRSVRPPPKNARSATKGED